ncbi:hypothetical protein [Spirochaeta africana]|uniref:DoxX protein n=1 Tax=Spirochaeta africana (strain ATCC 700263 / DSM 8902 / Z-7692) TaxID=889378 RepID=H9ULE9_SPIAZ|nr:hypothetical protein [Spirochaeta africana]AFG38342.1 hypothetical protein Spiaf_2310 [Spirochaeta africana DSM 8902]
MRRTGSSIFLLQLSLGIMFVMIGIAGISGATSGIGRVMNDMNNLFGGNQGTVQIIVAIIQLVAGTLLLLSLFGMIKENIMQILLLVILVLWALELALQFVLGGNLLQPDILAWLSNLAPNLVIFAGLWVVFEQRARVS